LNSGPLTLARQVLYLLSPSVILVDFEVMDMFTLIKLIKSRKDKHPRKTFVF
jgi:hypothetical protein